MPVPGHRRAVARAARTRGIRRGCVSEDQGEKADHHDQPDDEDEPDGAAEELEHLLAFPSCLGVSVRAARRPPVAGRTPARARMFRAGAGTAGRPAVPPGAAPTAANRAPNGMSPPVAVREAIPAAARTRSLCRASPVCATARRAAEAPCRAPSRAPVPVAARACATGPVPARAPVPAAARATGPAPSRRRASPLTHLAASAFRRAPPRGRR